MPPSLQDGFDVFQLALGAGLLVWLWSALTLGLFVVGEQAAAAQSFDEDNEGDNVDNGDNSDKQELSGGYLEVMGLESTA